MLRNLSRTLLIAGVAWLSAVPALTAQTTSVAPLRGDVDGDGRVTAADARIVADFLVGRPVPAGVSVAERGDVNGDGKVTSVDVAIIRAFAAGRNVSRFGVGAPLAETPEGMIRLLCVGNVRERSVECASPGAQTGGARSDIIVGNQNVFVKLVSSNRQVVGDKFSFDVTLQNLLAQRMGTTDGTTPDPQGIKIFFHDGPHTLNGTGEVHVFSGGNGMFTGSNQPFHQYSGATLGADGILAPNEVSSPVNWVLQFDPGVVEFNFFLYVNAPVQYQSGWVDVYADGAAHASSPYIVPTSTVPAGATVQLTDTVRNAVGKTVPGAPVTWSSSNNAIATVDANTGVVTAVSDGTATITATSGSRTGTATIIVSTASPATSTITPAPASLPVGDTSVITVQLKNGAGTNITSSGGTVALSASAGTLTPVVDNSNGTYTAKLTHTVVGEVKVSGTLNGVAITDTAEVTFTPGGVASFTVEAAAGGNIPDQLAGTPFNVKVTAKDAFGNTAAGFTGTVDFSSTPAGASGTSAAFVAGVLSSHAITIAAAGTYTLTATRTGGAQTGTSNSFQVQSPPTAVADAPLPTSVPGEPYHAAFNTALGATNLMTNDTRGFPLANVASFGGGSLGGTVTSNAAGSTVSPLPGHASGSLSVAADGSVSFTPPTGFTGLYTFQYRISNVRGTSDAQVTIAVGFRPAVTNDTYPTNVLGNVPINTATSTGFTVTTNDVGDAKVVALVGSTNGATVLNANGTFTFTPNAGLTGSNASFTYTVTNGFGTTAAATVTIPVSGIAWFVDADAATNGDGRLATPFKDLSSAFAAGTKPLANQPIFLYHSGTSYTGGVTLLGGQRLVGEGATGGSFAAVMNVTWPADAGTQPTIGGTRPTVVSGITLGSGNTLQGFNMGGAGTLTGNSFGTLTVSEVGINTTGQALNLTTGTLAGAGFTQVQSSGGTNNVLLSGVATSGTPALGTNADALSGASGTGFSITGGNGSFTYAGTITNGAALAVQVANKTGGAVVFSGDINPSAVAVMGGISVTGNNSGTNTITFSGANKKVSTGAIAGVSLSNNTGATIVFTNGGLVITTTSGAGFNATGTGGTVTVEGANNTIQTTTGTALTVTDVNIGGNGLTFRSITAGNGASGPANGIVMSNTGAAGFVTVTGDGLTPGSGGTIQRTTGANGATGGNGVYLSGTRNVSLSWMNFNNTANNGVYGTGVRGFTLNKSRFTASIGDSNNSGGSHNESAVQLVNVGGPVKLSNSLFNGTAYNAVRIENISATAPTLDSLVIVSDTVTSMQGSTADVRGTALLVNLNDGTADTRIRNNHVTTWWGNAIHVLVQGTASGTSRITGNFADNTNGALAGAGGIWITGGNHVYNISGNTVRHTNGSAISADRVNFGTNMNGTIDNNTIGVSGDNNSGTAAGAGIFASHHGPGTTTTRISNNILRQTQGGSGNGAIWMVVGDASGFGGSGAFNATVVSNNIQEVGTPAINATSGILATIGTNDVPVNDTDQVCMDIGGSTAALRNTITNFNSGTNRIRVNQRFGTTSRFPGYTGAATGVTSQTDLATYLLGRNNASTSVNANTSTGGFLNTSPAGSACAQPTL